MTTQRKCCDHRDTWAGLDGTCPFCHVAILAEAVEHACHDAESRLYLLPVNAEPIERDIITAQINIYKTALAKAGR